MKIAFHLNSLGRGGAERVVSVLSKEFAELGHDVTITTEWISDNEYPISQKVKRLNVGLTAEDESKGRLTKIVKRYTYLRKYVKQEKPDVVISFCNKANFRASIALLGLKTRLITSVRNDPLKDYAPYRISTQIMMMRANGCVFQTPDAQAFFRETFGGEAFIRKSVIIFNPLSEAFATEENFVYDSFASIRMSESVAEPISDLDHHNHNLNLSCGFDDSRNMSKNPVLDEEDSSPEGSSDSDYRQIVINAGRISAQKNQLLLVKAFDQIKNEVPKAILEIYGDTQDSAVKEEIEGFICEHKLEKRVFLKGLSEHLNDDLKKAYMFVLSSDYEGMPNALMEAMSLGLPCISTDCPCGGSRELIGQNEKGILIPVGDAGALAAAMLDLLQNPEKASALAREAAKIKGMLQPNQIAQKWLDFIKK